MRIKCENGLSYRTLYFTNARLSIHISELPQGPQQSHSQRVAPLWIFKNPKTLSRKIPRLNTHSQAIPQNTRKRWIWERCYVYKY